MVNIYLLLCSYARHELTNQTANLAKESKSITYDYDYHRLTGIN